ncbi:MAG: type I-B CRISPR-associated protein Cas5b [Anaeromicrobium sp.]|uniref:type I-B CRISPR-associated protein Cas5b n=1 Tax=Anaeromicrobium sp. TaxID=1929132 RepID=UPI0025FFDD94|nr:type I-B CRISPR-associated protein Cas5b [Anaeromicrobium sp.]MCT4594744.1 type I-B CRISPR-associated protein Cas5b [Anaeromicrobium sp.]
MNKCVVFNISGSYGRFRKPYTTTSALSFITIHPIAVKGIIGAIVGIDKDELYGWAKDIKIGIEVINPIKKDMQSFNLNNMKTNGTFRFPSNVEFLRDLKYRIYVTGDKVNELEKVLLEEEFVFTPYLGVSEHMAKVAYEYTKEDMEHICEGHWVDTLIPMDNIDLDFQCEYEINTDNIPVKNNEKREYTKYEKIVFTTEEKKLKGKIKEVYKVGDKHVFFF